MSSSPRTILGTFVAAHVINDFYATVLPAFLPALAAEWDLDYTELGLLSFSFTLFTGVLQPFIGHIADKQGNLVHLVIHSARTCSKRNQHSNRELTQIASS